MKRIVSSVIFLPIFILIVQYGNGPIFFIFLSLILLVALYEFFTLLEKNDQKCMLFPGMALGWLVLFSFFNKQNHTLYPALAILIFGVFLTKLLSEKPMHSTLEQISNTFFGELYIGFLLGYLISIRQYEEGRKLIFMLFLIIWLGDTFAYYIGSLLGNHKLAPAISPNKSLEGALGGLGGSLVGVLVAQYWFSLPISAFHGVILGLVSGVAGQMGDLCESMLKRNLKVKDSGFLIPGHGGVLDRLDSVLFSAPVFYYIYLIIH